MIFYWFLKYFQEYEEALWPKKLEISHACQILTNESIRIWFFLSYLITTVSFTSKAILLLRDQVGIDQCSGCLGSVSGPPSETSELTGSRQLDSNLSYHRRVRGLAHYTSLLAVLPQGVRQPKQLSGLDFLKQNGAAAPAVPVAVVWLSCLPKIYRRGPDQYQLLSLLS